MLCQPEQGGATADMVRRTAGVDFTRLIFETIDMHTFSNLWFWIALAVLWSSRSHWVMGVPWDMMQRARRKGSTHQQDVDDLAQIHAGRLLYIADVAGPWGAGVVAAVLSALAVLGFRHGIQFAQALFLMGLPISIVALLTLRVARRIRAEDCRGAALYQRLRWHRFVIQLIGMAAILVTTMWGMLQNLTVSVLGN